MNKAGKPLYFDHAATSPLLPVARQAMLECFDNGPANAHARYHLWGWAAQKRLDAATRDVMDGLSLSSLDGGIIWTSGATEANNQVLAGMLALVKASRRLVIAATEHASILGPARWLAEQGADLCILPVNGQGQIDLEDLEQAISTPTCLVSIMAGNNETGILHPVADIARICRAARTPFHCDASQCLRFGSEFVPDMQNGPDLMTLSGHKAGAPGGIGLLAWRGTAPAPILQGGGQQTSMRAGTIPIALVAGFAAAFRHVLTIDNWPLQDACQRFERILAADFPEIQILGKDQSRLPGFTALAANALVPDDVFDICPDLAMATGAACFSGNIGPSPVLQAMGLTDRLAAGSLRITGGHDRPSWHYELAGAQLAGALADCLD